VRLKWNGVQSYNFSMRRVDVIKIIMAFVLATSPLDYNMQKRIKEVNFSEYKPSPELVFSLSTLGAKNRQEDTFSLRDVLSMIKTGRSDSIYVENVSILKLGDVMNNYVNTHRQIISSVDGLEAVVDSLKSDDATITEYSVERVFDYKIGSLSDGKDVYARVKAKGIGGGGYSLIVYLYLVDKEAQDTIGLGGISLRRWGMPYNTNPSNPQDGLYYARLYEDVQTFIKALRVYEFKDRYVAFFSAQEYLPRMKTYIHYHNIYVFPKAKEGEGKKKVTPSVIRWEVQGAKEKLKFVDEVFAVGGRKNEKFYFALVVGVGDGKKGYSSIGLVDQEKRKLYSIISSLNWDWSPPGNIEYIVLSSR